MLLHQRYPFVSKEIGHPELKMTWGEWTMFSSFNVPDEFNFSDLGNGSVGIRLSFLNEPSEFINENVAAFLRTYKDVVRKGVNDYLEERNIYTALEVFKGQVMNHRTLGEINKLFAAMERNNLRLNGYNLYQFVWHLMGINPVAPAVKPIKITRFRVA